jgi:hypothetical protein
LAEVLTEGTGCNRSLNKSTLVQIANVRPGTLVALFFLPAGLIAYNMEPGIPQHVFEIFIS